MTRPSVLAGPETAQEHIRNAMQLLARAEPTDQLAAELEIADLSAIKARLRAALAMLEGKP
jgi:hypothetical protein